MSASLITSLVDATFYAFVGLYEEEYKIPNQIIVNIDISKNSSIEEPPMVDYSQLLCLTKEILRSQHFLLLEDIITAIRNRIHSQWSYDHISISIAKAHPPTGTSITSSRVTWVE